MKTNKVATGILGALAIAGALGLSACSAEVGSEGEGAIGSESEALNIAGLPNSHAAFKPAFTQLDTSTVLIAGGYTDPSGTNTAIATVKTFNSTNGTTGSYASRHDLNTARYNAKVAQIPGHTDLFLIVGGQTTFPNVNADLASAEIFDQTNNTMTTISDSLASPRYNFELVPCGDKLLVAGGVDDNGLAVNTLEVFTYNPGSSGAASTFDPMKNKLSPFNTVTMNFTTSEFGSAKLSATKVILYGGASGATLRDQTDILTVDSACNLDVGNSATVKPAVGDTLPAARARFASGLVTSLSLTVGGTARNYDVIIAGGKEASTVPTVTYFYDAADDRWDDSSVATPSLPISVGRVSPIFVPKADNLLLVGGLDANFAFSSAGNSLASAEQFASGSWSQPTVNKSRAFGWAAYLNSGATPFTGAGTSVSSGVLTMLTGTKSTE